MIPLQENVSIQNISFKNVRLELNQVKLNKTGMKRYLKNDHYAVLHRGRVILSGVEGNVSSGEVNMIFSIFNIFY